MDKNKENPELETEVEVEAEAEAKVEAEAKKDADQAVALPADDAFAVDEAKKKNTKLPVIIAVIAVLVIAVGCIIYFAVNSGKDKNGTGEESTTAASEHASDDNSFEIALDERRKQLIENPDEVYTDFEGNTVAFEQRSLVAEATTSIRSIGQEKNTNVIEDKQDTAELIQQIKTKTQTQKTETTTAASNPQNNQPADPALEQIGQLFAGNFFMQGTMYADNTSNPMIMAFRGDDFEVTANLEGIELDVMRVGGKFYLKRVLGNGEKQFCDFSSSIMKTIGISEEEFNLPFGELGATATQPLSSYDVKVNGKAGKCYVYARDTSTIIKCYTSDGEFRQLDILDESGEVTSSMTFDVFSTTYPADMFSLKGYTKTSFGNLFLDVAEAP